MAKEINALRKPEIFNHVKYQMAGFITLDMIKVFIKQKLMELQKRKYPK